MSNEQWIDNAFAKARKEAGRANNMAVGIRNFLDENTEGILDKWKQLVGEDVSLRVARLLQEDEELCDAFETMSETFFTAGVLYGRMRYRNKR